MVGRLRSGRIVAALGLMCASFVFAQDFVIGFVAGGTKFDGSYHEVTWSGIQAAVEDLADQYEIVISDFEGDIAGVGTAHRTLAENGADLIFAPGIIHSAAVEAVSQEYPNTRFVVLDSVVPGVNVRSVLFDDAQGSYLVGFIAGSLSQTGVIGFVGGMDIPLLRSFQDGFEQGIGTACPSCTVLVNYIGATPAAFSDPNRARELASIQHAQGADIIYAVAGLSGHGVINFVNETMCYEPTSFANIRPRVTPLTEALVTVPRSEAYLTKCGKSGQPVLYVGVDSNQNPLGDTDGNPDTLNHGLTSMVKRLDLAAYDAVSDLVAGRFQGGTVMLGLAEEGVGYVLDDYNRALFTDDFIAQAEALRLQVIQASQGPDASQE